MDLSATPFFLRGSGYVEGTLFPWAMSDFSLMDAIECGIVKLPRVPVSEQTRRLLQIVSTFRLEGHAAVV
jgi:type III restriction enzyme